MSFAFSVPSSRQNTGTHIYLQVLPWAMPAFNNANHTLEAAKPMRGVDLHGEVSNQAQKHDILTISTHRSFGNYFQRHKFNVSYPATYSMSKITMPHSGTNGMHETKDEGRSEVVVDADIVLEDERFQINGARIWNEIMETSSLGGIPNTTGMNRLALSESDKEIRDYFVEQARLIGCRITVDKMGNIFAVLPGLDDKLPPIGIGSHLDTQPNGKKMKPL